MVLAGTIAWPPQYRMVAPPVAPVARPRRQAEAGHAVPGTGSGHRRVGSDGPGRTVRVGRSVANGYMTTLAARLVWQKHTRAVDVIREVVVW